MAEDPKKLDMFFRQSLYPDAEGIFSFRPRSLEDIKDECFVVLDTNSLLVPYTTGKQSLEQIRSIYKKLVGAKRLVVPGQVAREFAEHRVTKLRELYQQISRKRASIGLGNYPLLGSLDEYQKALELEKNLNELVVAYNNAISRLLEVISQWYWNDPVSALYGEFFAHGVVLDPAYDQDDISKRLEHDVLHKLPPGYKDAHKADDGVGDLLIWRAILDVATKNQKSVIFVSLDQKADWWSQSEGRPLYPRFELVDEFRRLSGGQSFHTIKFSKFLDLYGATEEVVEEVRKGEQQVWSFEIDHTKPLYETYLTENAVYDWLISRFNVSFLAAPNDSGVDYVAIDDQGRKMGVQIKIFRDAYISKRRFAYLASQILLNKQRFEKIILVLVARDEKAAFALYEDAAPLKDNFTTLEVVTGILSSSGEFLEYPTDLKP